MIRPADIPIAGGASARVVKLAHVGRTAPAVVLNLDPLRMTITHDKIQSSRVSRGAEVVYTNRILTDILAICLPIGGVTVGFLAKDNRGGGTYHSASSEPKEGEACTMQARAQ